MRAKIEVSTSPRTLQHIALASVVIFALVMSYAIHLTNQTVANVKANHYDTTQNALDINHQNGQEASAANS